MDFPLLDVDEDKYPIGVTKMTLPKNFDQILEAKKAQKEARRRSSEQPNDFIVPETPASMRSVEEDVEVYESSSQTESIASTSTTDITTCDIDVQVDAAELRNNGKQKKTKEVSGYSKKLRRRTID